MERVREVQWMCIQAAVPPAVPDCSPSCLLRLAPRNVSARLLGCRAHDNACSAAARRQGGVLQPARPMQQSCSLTACRPARTLAHLGRRPVEATSCPSAAYSARPLLPTLMSRAAMTLVAATGMGGSTSVCVPGER
jgi:hypothetical protein